MSLIAKIMSDENAADEDSRKAHRLITGLTDIQFERYPDQSCSIHVMRAGEDDYEEIAVHGNVYVMNENGKTISSFGSAPLDFQHTIFIDGRPITDIRLDGPVSVSLLRELLEVPPEQPLIRVGDEGYDLIPAASSAKVFPKNGDRFLTDADA